LRIWINELDSRCDESCASGCKRCDREADNRPDAEEVVVGIIARVDMGLGPIVKAVAATSAATLERRQSEDVSKKS
jgi:hypothetical protein